MPHARDRLDLIVLPADHHLDVDARAVCSLFDRWQAAGLLAAGTGPMRRTAGPRAWALLPGGFGVVWLDRPRGLTLYANQLGGFRVLCPRCGGSLARAFGHAVEGLRRGGPDIVSCPACGHQLAASQIALSPPGALARGAVIF
ncbi:MAG: flavodoxin-dependent (E)-4-hydroxy-3-methylbut-2-enyl-diphosphate synthase, partial [Oligoflexia bacterium]|nr:flavodoxin-dependent (E)-4-hydroxy-3-methylbut-2-enyl-diphosphate synthase [Oligoflexia bacterium]